MARSTSEIQEEIIASKEARTDLNGLNSTSQTAVWRLWTRVTAEAIRIFEVLMDALRDDIELIARSNSYGTAVWWRRTVQIFQYSATDPQQLEIDENFQPVYPTINEDLQIITKSAVRDQTNDVLIMVNKSSGPLGNAEISAFEQFVEDIKPAGITTVVRSVAPDVAKITASVYFDKQIGETQTFLNIEESLATYLSTLNERGEVFVQSIVDAIQSAEGVVDVDPTTVQVEERRDTELIGDYDIVARVYDSYAGFSSLETDGANDLSSTLTFIEYT